MRRMTSVVLALGLGVMAGCAPKAETAEQAEARMTADAAGARTAIEASNLQFAAHFNAGHGDSVATFYAENGRLMEPNAAVHVGRAAIAASISGMVAMKATLALTTEDVMASGPLAIERGTYKITLTPPGAPAPPMGFGGAASVPTAVTRHRKVALDASVSRPTISSSPSRSRSSEAFRPRRRTDCSVGEAVPPRTEMSGRLERRTTLWAGRPTGAHDLERAAGEDQRGVRLELHPNEIARVVQRGDKRRQLGLGAGLGAGLNAGLGRLLVVLLVVVVVFLFVADLARLDHHAPGVAVPAEG